MINSKKSFRIGMDAKRAFHNNTGLGVYSRSIINILTRFYPSINLILFNPKKTSKYQFAHQEILPQNFITKKFHSFWRTFLISSSVKNSIDIYHGLSAEMPYNLPKNIKKIVTIHDLLFERYPSDYSFFDRFMQRIKTKYACKTADKIIAVSEATKQDLIDFYKIKSDKIAVIGIPFENENKLKSQVVAIQKPFVICIASFIARKNQLTLVKAFEKIANNVDFDIVLVGNPKGRYYKKVANAIENSIYRHRIHTLSHLLASEIKWLYENALFSIYPSHYEGFGIPVLESIAHNCPLLASKIKSTEEISNNIPLFFNPNSTDDLAEKMEYIYNHLDVFKTKTQTHRIEILEKYSDKKIADILYYQYSQLLSKLK